MVINNKIIVHKCGVITGVGRYTEIPFDALVLSEHNMMFSKDAKRKEFAVSLSKRPSSREK